MIRNIIKISARSILQHKLHTIINVLGLSAGFTAYILVSLFINYEFSWDKHNEKFDRIYRVQRHFVMARHAMDGNDISPHTRGITARLMFPKYPEIESTMIMKELNGVFLSADNVSAFNDHKEGISAEQSIFQIFSYHFIQGDKDRSLIDPYSIVLSETLAKKLFPSGNAMGKMVMIERKFNMKVTGVYEDLPQNSTLRPGFIISLSTLEKNNEDVRNSNAGSYMTYVLLKPNQDVKSLNTKLWDLFKFDKSAEDEKIKLCPMSKLYLSFNDQTAYRLILSLYRLIGIFILLLAAFNYVNLTTANTSVRTKEIGVRKVHGSHRSLLIFQFLGETLILAVLAVNLAFFFTELLLPTFNTIVQKPLSLSYSKNWVFILNVTAIAVLTGLLAGIYPAFFMSAQKITNLFKGNIFKAKRERFSLKKILVTLQFSISMFLIILTIAFTLQIKFLLTKELGVNKENVLYATLNVTRKDTRFEELHSRIMRHHEIISCSMSSNAPFVSFGGGVVNWEGCQPGDVLEIRNNTISYGFLENYEIKLKDGREFSREFPADAGKSCLVNETAAKCFGYDNPIGKRIDNGRLEIVGVMKDFHYKDMYNTIEPAIYELAPDTIRGGRWIVSFRVPEGKIEEAKSVIKQELEDYFPNDPFEIQILSEVFRSENVFRILGSVNNSLMFFTVLNIMLAAVGLLGLVTFTTKRRTKEIGIRKINGSSSWSILLLLSKEYLMLLFFASLISWPFGYYAFERFPGNYKVVLPVWVFIFSSVLIGIISLATALYHTLKAAYTNPVEALRYE